MNDNSFDNRVQWQIDCDNTIINKENVILSSPTGSGKTKRYEHWALSKPERPIFITSPIKSLSNQKFRLLQADGYKVGLETGDIQYMPYEDCDIICCTQEIYNNKYRDYKNSTLIIDEFSYIFEVEDRARAYIDSLYYSQAKNILICSATFGNPKDLTNYLNKLTNRDFFLYESNERLTTLEYKGEIQKEFIRDSLVVTYSKEKCVEIAQLIYQDRITKIQDIMRKSNYYYDPRKRNKDKILQLVKQYNIDNTELIELSLIGVVYYYGRLLPKEKLFVEDLFENSLIDTVVGTDALALGVNFPIKNVIFTQLHKYHNNEVNLISKNLFEQLSGRAGRKGYFDNGYVYYCDDFKNTGYYTPSKSSLKPLFNKLVNEKNEDINISLTANIKNILTKEKTIEEEAEFITKYSTTPKDFEEEKTNITTIIDYITSIDIADYYLKEKFKNLDFESGYNSVIENCSQKTKKKIDELSLRLTILQPYFDKDIGNAYLIEYSPQENCNIFIDVLLAEPLEVLITKYGQSFYDLLLLRKYIYKLPDKYKKQYDISLLDEKINEMDYTTLHPNTLKKTKIENNRSKDTKRKIASFSFTCPNYFDVIKIDDKKYVKLLIENGNLLLCDYSDDNNLNLYFMPANTKYELIKIVKKEQRLEILNRLNLETLISDNGETIDKIEAMKKTLKKVKK